jgi:hypothetical protein
VHRGFGEPLLITRTRALLCHFERAPAKHCHQLMRRRAAVCCDGRARLARPVGAAVAEACLVALFAKLVTETCIAERARPVLVGHQISHVAARRSFNDLLEYRKDRQR